MNLIAKKNTAFEQYIKECIAKVKADTDTIFDLVESYCGIRPSGRSTSNVFEFRYIPTWRGFLFNIEPDVKLFKKEGDLYDVVGRYKAGKVLRNNIETMKGISIGAFTKFGIPYEGKGYYFGWSLYEDTENDACGLNVSPSMFDYLKISSKSQFTLEQN